MESKSAQRIYKTIMLIIIVIITTSLITAFATYQYLRNNVLAIRKGNNTSFEGLEYTLSQFRTELENKYIGEINDEELIDGALKGYVNALGDPYTTYLNEEETKKLQNCVNIIKEQTCFGYFKSACFTINFIIIQFLGI